jgi:PIN domain nuclease of toxin-antitoxin system
VNVLTDTHTLVSALSKPHDLGTGRGKRSPLLPLPRASANPWELVLKARKPGALLADPLPWWNEYVTRSHMPTLAVRTAHIRVLAGLPEIHKDPFDRILAAQALAENIVLLTHDSDLARYGIPLD